MGYDGKNISIRPYARQEIFDEMRHAPHMARKDQADPISIKIELSRSNGSDIYKLGIAESFG